MKQQQKYYNHTTPCSPSSSKSVKTKPNHKKNVIYRYRRIGYLAMCTALVLSAYLYTHHSYTSSDSLAIHNKSHAQDSTSQLDISTDDLAVQEDIAPNIIGELTHSASDHPNAKLILSHLNEYPTSLVELASKKPETIDFVAHYVDRSSEKTSPLSVDLSSSQVPLFLQWDERWGYNKYGDDFLAINGCGPTCLSMVLVSLTHDTTLTPDAVAKFSDECGYLDPDQGTSWSLMTDGAAKLGITGTTIPADEQMIYSLLDQNLPIIASMRPGHFTTEGHFIVLRGVSEDGNIYVNDPDSLIRSQETWPLDTILSECKNLWSYEA